MGLDETNVGMCWLWVSGLSLESYPIYKIEKIPDCVCGRYHKYSQEGGMSPEDGR